MAATLKLRRMTADNSVIREATDEHGKDGDMAPADAVGRSLTVPGGQTVKLLTQRAFPQCLHICPQCGSRLVQPIECGDVGAGRWELALHCPNCRWSHTGTFRGDQLAELEDTVDSGFDELLQDLRRLRTANLTDEIERFAAALEADLILPEDF